MIDTMPRPRPPGLQRETTRHGQVVWYVRLDRGHRIRIKAPYGTPEFQAQYEAALSGRRLDAGPAAVGGTLAWLYEQYREVGAWRNLSAATRRQRENILRQVMAKSGHEPAAAINQKSIAAGRDKRASTPAQARHFLDAMRGLFRWAKEARHIKVDPTEGVKPPSKDIGAGFPAWTEAEADAYETRWPRGTRQRVWFDVLQFTGLRRGDAVRLGRQHVKDGVASIVTQKTGTPVSIRILPPLAETLAAGPTGDLAFICGARGEPLGKETFGNEFRDACRAAGVRKSAHGLRKLGATRAAEAGATETELEALFGWSGGRMAALYTKTANRKRVAVAASDKLSIPAPDEKVRERNEKS